ncbi:MAG: protein kinase [Thiobacillus sp.]
MKIGRYEILDEVGQGAMGTVYRARDPLIERTVAIKTVPIAQLRQEGKDAESRFLREAQSAGRLSHTNIVTIYDVGETDELAYIAMEYLSGATLRDVMNMGPMPVALALDTAVQMAEALAFAHEHGVIHRDIKPANVIVTGQRGRIKLTDFGIAHLVNSDHTHTGQMLGSPRYMSPEQAMGHEVDGRSDIFSLGAVLYEMLTGQYAFDGDSLPTILYRVINETPVSAVSLRSGLPAGLVSLLASMLQKNPQARPDARALVSALHVLTPAAPPSTAIAAPEHMSDRSAYVTTAGMLVLIGAGILVGNHFLHTPRAGSLPPTHADSSAEPLVERPAAGPLERETIDPAAPAMQENGKTSARESAKEPDPKDPYLVGLDEKQVELRILRTELLLKYTEEHPDVVQVDRQLEQLRIERRQHLRKLKR